MGQINLPVLNRTGYSTFWQSVWDDKHNFNRGFKEDTLIRSIIPFIFLDRISKKKQFIHFNVVKSTRILQELEYWNQFATSELLYQKVLSYFKRKKKIPYFPLKIWILKFQTWVLILFSIYSPVKFFSLFMKQSIKYNLFKHFGYYYLFTMSNKFSNSYLLNLKYKKNIL